MRSLLELAGLIAGLVVHVLFPVAGTIVEELAEADTPSNTRFNDAKCDSSGRMWCGTMDIDPSVGDQGAYYSFTKGKVN